MRILERFHIILFLQLLPWSADPPKKFSNDPIWGTGLKYNSRMCGDPTPARPVASSLHPFNTIDHSFQDYKLLTKRAGLSPCKKRMLTNGNNLNHCSVLKNTVKLDKNLFWCQVNGPSRIHFETFLGKHLRPKKKLCI